jgi:hypothetical protein
MTDIELVIKIPEEVYNSIQDNDYCGISNADMYNAVKNGTPLPKGHGDLIDRNEVIKILFDYHNGKKTIGQCIDDVPTIIEAEKR